MSTETVIEVQAEAHSDDRLVEVVFDAAPWLASATPEEIIDLHKCDWCNDYPADYVAHAAAEYDSEVAKLFTYLEIIGDSAVKKDCGFECSVNAAEAMKFLREKRPNVAKDIDKLEDDDLKPKVKTERTEGESVEILLKIDRDAIEQLRVRGYESKHIETTLGDLIVEAVDKGESKIVFEYDNTEDDN